MEAWEMTGGDCRLVGDTAEEVSGVDDSTSFSVDMTEAVISTAQGGCIAVLDSLK